MSVHVLVETLGGIARGEADGGLTTGQLVTDDDGHVRWISHDDLRKMQGVGVYNGATGFNVYQEDLCTVHPHHPAACPST